MKVKPIEEIKELCRKIADLQDIEVVDVEFKNGDNPSLTIFIDKEGGVDLDTCEKYHMAINEPLDELDPTFNEPYTLNVSSIGLDWPFKTNNDFEKNLEKEVEVKLYASIKGKKFHEGILTYFDDNIIRLKISEKDTLTIERKSIVKINKAIKFE